MTLEQRLQAWLTTWQGWVALITGFLGAVATATLALRKAATAFGAAYKAGVFLIDLEGRMGDIASRMERIEEGMQNLIQGRRGIMEEDSVKGWFECDEHGKFTWANRMWRELTGMESDHVRGHGWEAGIDNDDREEFLKRWRSAFDHQRIFEDRATLVNRITGKKTEVRFACWPIRNEHNGKILSHLGHCTIDKRKS